MARAKTTIERLETHHSAWLLTILTLAILIVIGFSIPRMVAAPDILSEANFLFFTLLGYLAASTLYVAFAATRSERYYAIATKAALAGFFFHTLAAAHRWYAAGRPPFSNIYEMLLCFGWALVGMDLLVEYRLKARFAGVIALPIASLALILTQVMPSEIRPLVPALQSTWLHIHVTLAMFGYAACAISFALAILFLIKDGVKLQSMLSATALTIAAIYLAILETSTDRAGNFLATAWDFGEGHRILIAEKTPLLVAVPGLGWFFLVTFLLLLAPMVLVAMGRLQRNDGIGQWAFRIFGLATVLQLATLGLFIARIKGGPYMNREFAQAFPTSFAANPFVLAGIATGVFFSLLFLVLWWKYEEIKDFLSAKELLDTLTYKSIAIAFPLLTFMIATGAYWANRTWGSYWSWDPKETWALITWLVYAGYLHMRMARGWRGRRAAYFAIFGFAVVMFTFFGVTYLLPGLHAYA